MQSEAAVTVLILSLVLASERSFVDTAPISEGSTDERTAAQDSSVQELENLKHSLGKTIALIKSQSTVYSNVNGQKESHTDAREQVNENGKLLASVGQHIDSSSDSVKEGKPTTKVQTDIEIPSEGIHKSVVQHLPADYPALTENGNRRSPLIPANINTQSESSNTVDKVDNFSGVQYSPLDMAEYVFWTGDEKGVTLAIEEFLQEGLMSREEAITFLQEIKYNLEYLKGHYTQLGLNSRDHSKDVENSIKQHQQPQPQQQLQQLGFGKSRSSYEKPELRSNFDLSQLRQEANKKRMVQTVQPLPVLNKGVESDKIQDEDYDELLERLRVADFLYTEYSLEEVIYQLAKVMFTQSLTRGSAEAQQALQKFTNFLEMEAEQGHISRALEKKVLDVLIASLSDTLTEHPELWSVARESLDGSTDSQQNFIRQILEMNPDEKISTNDFFAYKNQNRNSQSQLKDGKLTGHVPLGLGKYKNP